MWNKKEMCQCDYLFPAVYSNKCFPISSNALRLIFQICVFFLLFFVIFFCYLSLFLLFYFCYIVGILFYCVVCVLCENVCMYEIWFVWYALLFIYWRCQSVSLSTYIHYNVQYLKRSFLSFPFFLISYSF